MDIQEVLDRGVTNIIPNKSLLEKRLKSKEKLNVYLGIDPTATKIHIGHAVALRKLQQFVELGHNVTFLIGDFTALIGDTSDKDKERPVLTYEEIQENFKSYKSLASKVIDFSKVEVKFNSSWLKKLTFEDIIKLTQHFSFGEFAGRELIKKRLANKTKVGLHEALYPVMQGYDSYFMDTDIQIGGADQTFNMQAGRILQKDLRDKESFIVVTGYLEGTDGRKMSKSWRNAIWLDDEPNEMYAKIMSLRDNLIVDYFVNATRKSSEFVKEIEKRLKAKENPINIKKELAFTIVSELHSEVEAQKAQESFEQTFQKRQGPQHIKVVKITEKKIALLDLLFETKMAASRSEAKRLISQNAVDVNGKLVNNPVEEVKIPATLKVGKTRFVKVETK